MWTTRRLGILLHPTSLPNGHGMGDFGPEARRFVDWLAACGAKIWQILPLCPPSGPRQDVPYASWASLAGHDLLISLDDLVQEGLLNPSDLYSDGFIEGWLDYENITEWKRARIDRAADRLLSGHRWTPDFEAFFEQEGWARDAALFAAIGATEEHRPWWQWPSALKTRDKDALETVENAHRLSIRRFVARQFLFERQWQGLRQYARDRGIMVLGDVPIYVNFNSVDVWTYPQGIRMDENARLSHVSGCPPDDFSAEGQLWGGPLYDWAQMARDGYAWWQRRLKRAFAHADIVRLDHFRAFSAYWEIPADATSARMGRWVPGPGRPFFEAIERGLQTKAFCVEDLGTIDNDVHDLRDALDYPGMRILHYGFGGGADNLHLPHNVPKHAIVYPGNHDNDTTLGWWYGLSTNARSHVQHYFGRHGDDIVWDINRAALACHAHTAVLQMQDVLALGPEARMNNPASYALDPSKWNNWRWRLHPGQASEDLAARLWFLGSLYGRV